MQVAILLHNHIHDCENHLQTALMRKIHDSDAWQHSNKYALHK